MPFLQAKHMQLFGAKHSFLKVHFQVGASVLTKPSFQLLRKLPVEGAVSFLKPATPKKFSALDKGN